MFQVSQVKVSISERVCGSAEVQLRAAEVNSIPWVWGGWSHTGKLTCLPLSESVYDPSASCTKDEVKPLRSLSSWNFLASLVLLSSQVLHWSSASLRFISHVLDDLIATLTLLLGFLFFMCSVQSSYVPHKVKFLHPISPPCFYIAELSS